METEISPAASTSNQLSFILSHIQRDRERERERDGMSDRDEKCMEHLHLSSDHTRRTAVDCMTVTLANQQASCLVNNVISVH